MNRTDKIKDLLRRTYKQEPDERIPDPIDERILADASSTMKQAVDAHRRTSRTFLWRTIMKSNRTKWATAAMILIATIVGINHFAGPFGASSVALADVIMSIQQANTVVWREHRVMTCEGNDISFLESNVARYYSLEHGGRQDMYNIADQMIYQVYWLPEKNERVEVIPFMKLYILNELTEAERAFNGKSVEILVEMVKSEETKKLGRRTIDGKETEGFEVRDSQIAGALIPVQHENLVARFWIDIKTSLPVRYEAKLISTDRRLTYLTGGKPVDVKVIGDQPEWDVELDPGIFDPNIPDDFKQIDI